MTRRQLAEQIAAEKGVKIKSAMRYLQRAAAPVGKQQIKNPRFSGLSETLKQKAASAVQSEREKRQPTQQQPPKRREKTFRRKVNVGLKATFDFYGNDKRHRQINVSMYENEILEAESLDEAIENFIDAAQFLTAATVEDFEFFTVGGRTITDDYFD